ncbi:MAG: DEAD/DEAH box helicase [Thermoanaerobaculia bacterium]
MEAHPAAAVRTVEELRSAKLGGTVALNVSPEIRTEVDRIYGAAIHNLDHFGFWRDGSTAEYRPKRGLWLPQRRAIAFAHAYLSTCHVQGSAREAALVKMPTGTGKTAVIATLACASPLVRKTLILTPRAGLVHQMKLDLSFRFWGRALSAVYYDSKIHEEVDQVEIDRLEADVRRGTTAPARVLIAGQYAKIWAERDQERQILVSTFNALHLILGLKPPAHRSMYGRDAREVARSLKMLDKSEEDMKEDDEIANIEAFRDLLRSVDLVVVDEGHYEPAYSWSQAVHAIDKPTIIFTATPYRNDYKYFRIEGNFVFNLPWGEAVREHLVRAVRFEPPVAASETLPAKPGKPPRRLASYNERRFVQEFAATLAQLPEGKKVIVHAGTYQSLMSLQRAFFTQGEAAVLIHDAFTGKNKDCLDLRNMSAQNRKKLKELRFQHVRHTEKDEAAQQSRVWLHQYKLLEGIDDSRFVEIWLYDGLGSARQVVQQVGRAIRRPSLEDETGQIATIRGSSKRLDAYEGAPIVAEQTRVRWDDYLAYEAYAAERVDIAFIAETQLLASVKRAAPAVQYIAGEFRGGHLLDQVPTMSAFLLPRRGVVCRVRGILDHEEGAISDIFLDALQKASMEAMLLEERFDIVAVVAPEGAVYRDVRLIRYLSWGNSPYLARHHIPEWRLGVMAMVRAGRYLFILDTEGVCIDYARLGLLSPEAIELKRLFPRSTAGRRGTALAPTRTRIVETAAAGLDISELGLRSISVRKHALDEGYFDLAEASQVPTSVRGYGRLGDDSARRRLSFSQSSVADATYKLLAVKDYVKWTRLIGDAMADERIQPHEYFGRFAREVRPLDDEDGAPRSILLDLWDVLDVSDETKDERRWDSEAVEEILTYDTCCEVTEHRDDEDTPPRYHFTFGPYQLELKYVYRDTVPPAGRYSIVSEELNAAVADEVEDTSEREIDPENRMFGRRLPTSLTRLINQEQAFRIVPAECGVVYSHSHFYKPEVNEAVLSILEPLNILVNVVSEKGDTRVKNTADWARSTLFGLVYGWLNGAPASGDTFAEDLQGCGTVVCDDRGAETADFYGIDDLRRRVLVIHAKAKNDTPGVSARELQEVTRQAQASLAFAGSSRREFRFPNQWRGQWSVSLKDAGGATISRPRLIKGEGLTIQAVHSRLADALANPTYAKDVIMLTSGVLSASAARRAHNSDDQRDLQFLYFLASVRSTFDRAGVRYRIICNP